MGYLRLAKVMETEGGTGVTRGWEEEERTAVV